MGQRRNKRENRSSLVRSRGEPTFHPCNSDLSGTSKEQLQRANEQLEVTREELQSANEHLASINFQLQKRNEELARLTDDLTNFLESVSIPILMVNRFRILSRFTPAAANLLHLTPRDFGRPVSDLRFALPLIDFNQLMSACEQNGASERKVRADNGRWYSIRLFPYRTAQGNIDGALIALVDIHDLKQSEDALVHERNFVSAVLDAAEDLLVVIVDPKGRIVRFNGMCQKLTGYSEDEVRGRILWDFLLIPEEVERVKNLYRELASGKETHSENYWVTKDGQRILISWSAGTSRDAAGSIEYIIRTGIDITKRQQAEEQQRESENRFRNMANTAPVMIWMAGTDKLCTFFNKTWLDFTGRTLEQELGNGWAKGVHQEDVDQCLSKYSAAFDSRTRFQIEYRLRCSDGTFRWLLDSGIPRFTPAGVFEGYIGSCVDITELKRAQEENLSRQKWESLGVLAAGIAHDFNNLLGGIMAEAELAGEDIPAGSPAAEELQKIIALGVRAAEIVRELMVYAGRETTQFAAIDLSAVVEEMLALLRVSISKRAVLKTDLGLNLPAILGHRGQIHQVVMNLIINASEALGERNGEIQIATSLVTQAMPSNPGGSDKLSKGDYLRLEVSDTGRGMTEEEKSKLFDPFFTTKFAGRGLGLSVVQGVVRSHGGFVNIISAPGRGTRFQIFLPCAGQLPKAETETPLIATAQRTTGSAPTVLVVEDEDMLRLAVTKMLQKKGFSVIEAADGSAAINCVRDRKDDIHIVLLDMTIPGADSYEVVKEIERLRPNTKIIVTSAYSKEAGSRFLEVPQVTDFVRKPFQFDNLIQVLRKTAVLVNGEPGQPGVSGS